MKKKIIIIVAILAIAGLIIYLATGKKGAQIQFEMTTVDLDTIQNSVTATGTIEPVTEVEVGTQVSGIISKIFVDYNSIVKKGQVIAELDKTNLTSELNSAKANLASAKSELEYQKTNYERYKNLNEKGLVSKDEYENAYLSYRKALESYHTSVENVNKAETNIGYATITSPIDGVVLSKDVEEGQTVASSFSTPTLFTIAQDLTDMRVIADIDEADIGSVKEGQNVTFTVDAFPNDVFHGNVTQVRQEATEENNVVTYEVVISAPNKDLKLKPGLTANVTVNTLERTDVLSVRSKALRFTPAEDILGKSYKIVDCNGKNKLWTLEGNTLKAHNVNIGATDGSRTEIISGLSKGTKVVLSMTELKDETEEAPQEESNPFMPHPGKKKDNKNDSK
ncbi:MAG TPA: efflux RND transporter periplasmic adaptor subunit [Candidatus Paraprevotella stercorigallinarum]|jgi:HlyD family secretion protein|nr:efflux RND transporter periplasmic adaptor subunit [Candidatus Paraprevotella stercorigallinarum]